MKISLEGSAPQPEGLFLAFNPGRVIFSIAIFARNITAEKGALACFTALAPKKVIPVLVKYL